MLGVFVAVGEPDGVGVRVGVLVNVAVGMGEPPMHVPSTHVPPGTKTPFTAAHTVMVTGAVHTGTVSKR